LGGSTIYDSVAINSGVDIPGGACVPVGRRGISEVIVVNGIGATLNITSVVCDDGLVVCIGSINDYEGLSIDEMRVKIAEKYKKEHMYFRALDFIEDWYEDTKN